MKTKLFMVILLAVVAVPFSQAQAVSIAPMANRVYVQKAQTANLVVDKKHENVYYMRMQALDDDVVFIEEGKRAHVGSVSVQKFENLLDADNDRKLDKPHTALIAAKGLSEADESRVLIIDKIDYDPEKNTITYKLHTADNKPLSKSRFKVSKVALFVDGDEKFGMQLAMRKPDGDGGWYGPGRPGKPDGDGGW